jgi:excisionase family DNA binding protein
MPKTLATATVHRLELVPPQRGRTKRKEQTRQVVDVTLRTSGRMLLTVAEAAERLGIGRSTMYVLIADGQVDTVRVGRLRRIEPEALTAYISRMRTKAKAPRPA